MSKLTASEIWETQQTLEVMFATSEYVCIPDLYVLQPDFTVWYLHYVSRETGEEVLEYAGKITRYNNGVISTC